MGDVVQLPLKTPCPMCLGAEKILIELTLEWCPCPMCQEKKFQEWNRPNEGKVE